MNLGKALSHLFLKESVNGAYQEEHPLSRRLTEGEVILAKQLFGNTINYAAIELHHDTLYRFGLQNKNRAVAYFNKISFPGTAYSDDFSKDPDPVKQSVFIHELVHTWQQQNDVLHVPWSFALENLKHHFNYQQSYLYKLDADKDLTDYGFEQQAAMIQDYFLLTHHDITQSYKNRHIGDISNPEELKKSYESVLDNFLHNPAYARGYEDKRYTLGHPFLTKQSRIFFPAQTQPILQPVHANHPGAAA